MKQPSTAHRRSGSVNAALTSAVDTGARDPDGRISTGEYRECTALIRDGRSCDVDFSLEREGFVLVPHKTRVTDFMDADEVASVYFPEVEHLLRRLTGASRVVPFGRLRRSGNEAHRTAKRLMAQVNVVPKDFTQWSGPHRVHEKLPQEAEVLLRGRVAIIQIWRPVEQEILSAPLAMCDAQSVACDDFLTAVGRPGDEVAGKPGSRAAKGYYEFGYNREHRWFYFPRMRPDEALVFKTYDSETDGRARFTPHGSFDNSASPADVPPRENFDVRALVFF